MNIGAAAKASGISSKMIRYYESVGLLQAAQRSNSGYRVYSDRDIHNLRFIRNARDLGFSIKDIAALLTLWKDTQRRSSDVQDLVSYHVEDLEGKIKQLQAMVNTLKQLALHCSADARPECPILTGLEMSSSKTK